jgi:hypothetical protein
MPHAVALHALHRWSSYRRRSDVLLRTNNLAQNFLMRFHVLRTETPS